MVETSQIANLLPVVDPNLIKSDFVLKDYLIEHQGSNRLNINVSYTDKINNSPNLSPVLIQQIDQALIQYPNESDSWRILNQNLTQQILKLNPNLSEITINLEVLPSAVNGYSFISNITQTQPQFIPDSQSFLITNSDGNNIVRYDGTTGNYLGEFIPAESGGLFAPDTPIIGPDGNGDFVNDIYVTSGDKPATSSELGASAVLRYDGITGVFIDEFIGDNANTTIDETGGLLRPYGAVFGPDGYFYVASFLTDQILRYNGKTGEFLDVFAFGNQQPGGLNGPNGLLFAPDGNLYVTTQGSVAVNGKADFSKGLSSQILRYDAVGQSSVFATPEAASDGAGFVSLLGLALNPNNGSLAVSDFAGGIKNYDLLTGELLNSISTNYLGTSPSSNFLGGLTFGNDGNVYTVGFDTREGANNIGAILAYNPLTGVAISNPNNPNSNIFVGPDSHLNRPIGITSYTPPLFGNSQLTETWSVSSPNLVVV
ncbi:MAG TPA: PEP-CTERM sorting domain-containing protein [Planktothrix sp. UBA10369]|nr:PEP-CTERM sorting domain-containing protein [Planktothrix sp. UBA10369]